MAEINSHSSSLKSFEGTGRSQVSGFRFKKILLFFGLPVFTSLLLILSYPKFNFGFLAWLALAPLTIAIWKAKNISSALITGLVAGFCFYAGILYWIYITMIAGGMSAGISLLGWMALSFILSFEFIVIAGLGVGLEDKYMFRVKYIN